MSSTVKNIEDRSKNTFLQSSFCFFETGFYAARYDALVLYMFSFPSMIILTLRCAIYDIEFLGYFPN